MQSTAKSARTKIALPLGRILSFATITAAGFVLGKFSGILREMVVSAQFGLSAGLDAYLLAGLVPTMINNIVAGSTITAAVMPTFARYLAAGKRDEFWYAASVLTNVVLLITAGLTVLGMLLAGPIVGIFGNGLPTDTQAIATTMLVVMMPTLWLGAVLNMLMAVLNSLDRFTAPALIFLALNIGIIGTVVLLTPLIGVYAVAWGFLIGVSLQVGIQLIELRREHPQFVWKIDWHHPALRPVLLAFIPLTALSLVAQINLAVDRAMAAWLPQGSISALYYADSILGAFYMLGISLGIAVFPSLSRLAASNDWENTARTIVAALRMLIFILAPLTLLLIPFAVPTIGLILGRGKFDPGAVQMTAEAFVMYALGMIGIAMLYVLQRAFYALTDNVTPFAVGAVTAVIHIGLNFVLMREWAHAGIALSTSLTALIGALALVWLLQRRVRGIRLSDLAGFLIRCVLLAVLSAVPVTWLFTSLQLDNASLTARVIGVGCAIAGGGLYFLLALATRTHESTMLLDTARRFLRLDRQPVVGEP